MERFTKAIEKSIEHENFYSALILALTLPDICGRLSHPHLAKKSQKRYEEWFDKYLLQYYKRSLRSEEIIFMSGGDCYALRCALLHEGRDDIASQRARRKVISKFAFSTTGAHCCKIDGLLILNVQVFCFQICQGVKTWNEDYKGDAHVQSGMAELLTIQNQGFSPIQGFFIR